MRFGVNNAPELAKKYPSVQYRNAIDGIIKNIGLGIIRFETIRKKDEDFAVRYGLPAVTTPGNSDPTVTPPPEPSNPSNGGANPSAGSSNGGGGQPKGQQNPSGGTTQGGQGTKDPETKKRPWL